MTLRTLSMCLRTKVFLKKGTSSKADPGIYLVCGLQYSSSGLPLTIILGNGIVNADGELWRVQRKAGLNFLSNANLKVLTEVALPLYLKQSIRHLRGAGNGSVTDVQAVFHELTTQLMGRMAYDVRNGHRKGSFMIMLPILLIGNFVGGNAP